MKGQKMKLCPGPRCNKMVERWRWCCKWHWGQLTDDLRVGIINLEGPLLAAKKHEALQYLQGKYHERPRQNEEAAPSEIQPQNQ